MELDQRFYGIKKVLEPVARALSEFKKKLEPGLKDLLLRSVVEIYELDNIDIETDIKLVRS